MNEYAISAYCTAPRGVASNSGFEEEDRANAERRAQCALNSHFHATNDMLRQLASMIWQQDKYRYLCNEPDFIERFMADHDLVSREFSRDDALPEMLKSRA